MINKYKHILFLIVILVTINLAMGNLEYKSKDLPKLGKGLKTCSVGNVVYSVDFEGEKISCKEDLANGSSTALTGNITHLSNLTDDINATSDQPTDTDDNVVFNKINVTDKIEFSLGGSIDGNEGSGGLATNGTIKPIEDSKDDIGTTTKYYKTGYLNNIVVDTIYILSGSLSSDIIPFVDNSKDLGSGIRRFAQGWFLNIYLDNPDASLYFGANADAWDNFNGSDRTTNAKVNTTNFYFKNYTDVCDDNGKCMSAIGSGSGGGNPFDQSLNITDAPQFENLTVNNSIILNNGSVDFNISNDKQFNINLAGVHGSRTSKVIIEGKASGAGSANPAVLINMTSHNGNSALMKMLVNGNTEFLLDSDGDLTVGQSIIAGTLGFQGAVADSSINVNANNGLQIWTTQPNDLKRGRLRIGQTGGTFFGQDTPSSNQDFNYLTIEADLNMSSFYNISGALLNLKRTVVDSATDDFHYIKLDDIFVFLDKDGNVNSSGNVTSNYYFGDGSLLTGITGDNASWNKTYADTLYSDIEWDYNQTLATYNLWNNVWLSTYNLTYDSWASNVSVNWTTLIFDKYNSTWDNSGSCIDTQKTTAGYYLYNDSTVIYFNETFLNITIDARASGLGDNASWNKTYADTLYSGIEWDYNQSPTSAMLDSIYGCAEDKILKRKGSDWECSDDDGGASEFIMVWDGAETTVDSDGDWLGVGYVCPFADKPDCLQIAPFNMTVTSLACYNEHTGGGDISTYQLDDDSSLVNVICTLSGSPTCLNRSINVDIIEGSLLVMDFEENTGASGGHGSCTMVYERT